MGPEWLALAPLASGLVAAAGGYAAYRRRGLHRWLPSYLASSRPRTQERSVHLLICVCDHFEPKRGNPSASIARDRVRRWVDEYPKRFDRFRDYRGRPPQHTFFYPVEEYEPEYLDLLGGLCRAGYGDVEVHLHHDGDTADNLRRTLTRFKSVLHERHGLLRRDPATGEIVYGFIHGNWALDNSRSDGRHCGVDDELTILAETGCYADFTLPSAPSETQTTKINSIYWATGRPGCRKSHDTGIDIGAGRRPPNSLLVIQGPLVLDWSRPKFGFLPRIENGCLQQSQPPAPSRIDSWLRANVRVPGPDGPAHVVKLHTHGAVDANADVLLGKPMVRLHEALRERSEQDPTFRYSYVTAWELAAGVLAAVKGSEPGPEGRPPRATGSSVHLSDKEGA